MAPRLKQLELQGYKTFASRNQFEFPANITAIVGPNGAGKSNVADSLRWVLGEQSYTLLRGRKTEDMIFAGSEHRPRAGMAQATITFDNEDGWLPIEFSEVSISRRAYRDGQNEYLLNGQRVRLKEISELLARSGLAERTYTIIGQGLVDAALSLKPDERRKFFEEAAGIGLYRGRREEALTRLDTTRRNLERVQDILSELEPRLASLEKQAKRVIEYERIKADLQLLLQDWYGYHWHAGQRELLHAQEVFRVQDERLLQARRRLEEVERKAESARGKLQSLRVELNAWHLQSSELHRNREQISRNLAVLDERHRSLLGQEQSLKSDQVRLEEEQQARQDRVTAMQTDVERLKTELGDAQEQAAQARKNLEMRLAERERAERELRDARRALTDSETRQVQVKARKDEVQGRVEGLQKSLQNLNETLAREAQVLETARKALQEAETKRDAVQNEQKQKEREHQEHRQQVEQLETRRKKLQDERSRLEAERSRLRAQLDVLEQAERSFSGLNQGARFLLQAAKQGQLRGGYRPLNALLEMPAEYEVAIAAILGEHLDGVYIDNDADLEDALLLLEKGGKGRAVLFPCGPNDQAKVMNAPTDDGCLGVAAELVTAPAELQPYLKVLLGQVVVAQDRVSARRIARNLPPHARAVTLSGEVFWGSGVVVAGQDGRSGMISRPREKRELQTALESLENDLVRVTSEFKDLDASLEAARSKEKDLDRQVREAGQRVNQAQAAYQKASLEMEQVRQRSEWQRKQVTSLEEQILAAGKEIQQLETTLKELGEKVQGLLDQVRQRSRSLNGLPVEELQTEVNHWNTNAAVASRAVRDAEARLMEYQQVLTANQQRQEDVRRRIQELADALVQLEAEKAALKEKESGLNRQMDILNEQIQPAEDELAGMEKDYDTLQGELATAQQQVSLADRYATQAQLDLTRQRESLDNLRRKIEEDFGLVVLEYNENITGPTPLPLEGMVNALPVLTELPTGLDENISRQRALLRRMGAINPDAHKEYLEVRERYDFLVEQVEDLKTADGDLRKVITELDDLMKQEFRKTFDAVAAEFKQMFTRLFGGGSARLVLQDEENPVDTGIDIEARLPGRREQGLALLSGGERSLTAVALIFSLLKVSPTPFCVMDEVDAMLDEANVGRFCELLAELSQNTQFVLITHNRNTVQTAGVIYGVTMGRDSASQVISLRLDEIGEDMVR